MGNEEVDLVTVVKPQDKRSLLQRFEIPIDHLSYEYVSKCCESKELERIVAILRSGEEGIFPDLINHAEKRLKEVKPSSKILRVEEPVVTRAMLEPEDRKAIDEDMTKWMSEMQSREKDLEEGKALASTSPFSHQPEIRQPAVKKTTMEKSISLSESRTRRPIKPKSIASCDYAGWDKFDADVELDRIDLREEREQVESKNAQRMQREKREAAKKLSKEAVVDKLSLTATELSVMAEQEKNIGNEAYRAGDYEEALIRYNSSIGINSTVNGYNNRAITNIKLKRYEDAIRDCNVVLSMEYNNVTALMRRGLALEKLERNSEAVIDYQTILQLEPNNKTALAALNKLRKPSKAKKVRMKIEEEEGAGEPITASQPDEMIKANRAIEIERKKILTTEICFCDRAPGFSQSPKPPPHYKNNYCLEEPPPTRHYSKQKISSINSSKSHHSYFSKVKMVDQSPKLIIEELKEDDKKMNEMKSEMNKAAGDGLDKSNKKSCVKESTKREKKNFIPSEKNEKSGVGFAQKFGIGKTQNKIDVASKYERPTTTTIRAENIEDIQEDLGRLDSPYQFLHLWQSLKNDADLTLRSKLLRSLVPEDLAVIIGNKLDGGMLSTMFRCLDENFSEPKDADLAGRFLDALKNLPRFAIINLFMNTEDKKVLIKIINRVEEYVSKEVAAVLRNAYEV